MGFESNTGLGVNNHYGERSLGGFKGGESPSAGKEKEITVNFDGEALDFKSKVPAGAIVTEILDFFTGSIATATVGAQDISAANGAVANYVTVSATADLTITGPTAGSAVVKYVYSV